DLLKVLFFFPFRQGKMKVPEWTPIIKLAIYNELAPYDDDWFYVRAASVCRHLYIRSPAGVGSLTKIYGGRQRNGTAPSHFKRSSPTVARKVLQSLEGLKLIEKDANGGRRLTPAGRKDLDRIASQIKEKTNPRKK
ncbi:hypothetical protein FSP39_002948, partial [Pinctada imbricata]